MILDQHEGDSQQVVNHFIESTIEAMYALSDENRFLEVTYTNGEKEVLYFKDFVSGALIEGIVSRAKKAAVKRVINNGEKGLQEKRYDGSHS